jgi:hypothetical protein
MENLFKIKESDMEHNYSNQCFDDFFPKRNKKYEAYHQDIKSIPSYDLKAYKNLYDASLWAFGRKGKRDYCKRKCYNQRFSPNKYNESTNKFPHMEDLLDFIDLMDKDPTLEKSNCIFNIENREVLKIENIIDVNKNIEIYMKLYPRKELPKTYEELILMNVRPDVLDMNAPIKNGIQVLYDGKEGKLIVPHTEEASCKYGKGTKWCTSSEISTNYFKDFNFEDRLYIWIQKPGKYKYQFYFPTAEFNDAQNKKIPIELFNYFRNENPITKKLFHIKELEMIETFENKEPSPGFLDYLILLKYEWPQLSESIQKDPNLITTLFFMFQNKSIHLNFFELFFKNPVLRPLYVYWINNKLDPFDAYLYSAHVIKGRWKEAEPILFNNKDVLKMYLSHFGITEEELNRTPLE